MQTFNIKLLGVPSLLIKECSIVKAAVIIKQGKPDVIEVQEVEKPVPRDNEILVKVKASSVTIGDTLMRKIPRIVFLIFRLFGVKRKKIPGVEVAGEIEAIGSKVTLFKVGDEIVGTTTTTSAYGGNAEYVCLPEKCKGSVLTKKPAKVSFEDIVSVQIGGMTALYLLRKANISKGDKVLIYGASGSVGTFAVQLANYFGAEVTGICSTSNIDLVKSLGASKVIDYTKEDFTESKETYDIVFDAVRKLKKSKGKNVLKPQGRYVSVSSPTEEINEELEFLCKLVENGDIKAVIDKRYTLEQIVDAHRYVETGRKRGNVIITYNT